MHLDPPPVTSSILHNAHTAELRQRCQGGVLSPPGAPGTALPAPPLGSPPHPHRCPSARGSGAADLSPHHLLLQCGDPGPFRSLPHSSSAGGFWEEGRSIQHETRMMPAKKGPESRYPLHYLVWHNQSKELEKELAERQVGDLWVDGHRVAW